MRIIVHLSDLHFGRTDPLILQPLISAVAQLKPHLVAISGDLTQRARSAQFQEARRFMDALPKPQIVVPGNHDIPLFNVFARFLQPLRKYRRHITGDLEPFHHDTEIAVLGINTARSFTIKDGKVSHAQIARINERFCDAGDVIKILVTHHPFDLPEHHTEKDDIVGRAPLVMQALATCGVDVLLSGHLHQGHTSHTSERYNIAGHSALVIQAGTASSTRTRKETNSFNVIRVEATAISVERHLRHADRAEFAVSSSEQFVRTAAGWARRDNAVALG